MFEVHLATKEPEVLDDSQTRMIDQHIGLVLDGRYEIKEFIAQGGMGAVYKAIQNPLGRQVAVKLLHVRSRDAEKREEFRKRFFLEASLSSRLTHPNIVRVYDFGTNQDQTYYIAMEYIEGQTLEKLINTEGALQPMRVLGLMDQACAALSDAHEQGLVHRDIKLRNLMVTQPTKGSEFLRVLDFGLVSEVAEEASGSNPKPDVGSPMYMSPEQLQNHPVDHRSDIYSLGIVMFILLTKQAPFVSNKWWELMRAHIDTPPPRLSDVAPNRQFPESLEALVQKALQKDPNDRYEDTYALMADLDRCAHDLLEAGTIVSPSQGQGRRPDILDGPTEAADSRPLFPPEPMTPDSLEWKDDLAHHRGFQDRADLNVLHQTNLRGYVAYLDFNCPFCFALHERLLRWDVADRIDRQLVTLPSHVLDGPFAISEQAQLADEVFALHRSAPDVSVLLPPRRCDADLATRLCDHIHEEHPDQYGTALTAIYRTLWQQGEDIGDPDVLRRILRDLSLPDALPDTTLPMPDSMKSWQTDWEQGPYDKSIPVMRHLHTDRTLIGLPSERTLMEFLLQQRTRVIDSAVCYFQSRPTLLVAGDLEACWPLLQELRADCELLQSATAEQAAHQLRQEAKPELMVIDAGLVDRDAVETLARVAEAQSVSWVMVTDNPDPASETWALSLGAAEYLPLRPDDPTARDRLYRVLNDRYCWDQRRQTVDIDVLTGLPNRRHLIGAIEQVLQSAPFVDKPASLMLLDVDRFHQYNKTHGPLTGDQCLQRLATILRSTPLDSTAQLARFGGNEFALFLPGANADEARTIGLQLQRQVVGAQPQSDSAPAPPPVTVSLGIGSVHASMDRSNHELLECADLARAHAKAQGGDCIKTVVAQPDAEETP